jgi:hypothetical protein
MLKSTVDSNEQSEHAAHVPPRPWVTRSCMILWGCPGHQLVIFSGHEKNTGDEDGNGQNLSI